MKLAVLPFVLVLFACSREPLPQPAISSLPLRERAAHEGKRFRRVPSAESGVQFRNELRRQNVIAYVYSGAGLAVGDYDSDGLPDLYLVSQDGANKLFRQVSPLCFEDVTEAAGGLGGGDAWGKAASFADVDGDADLDLYVCNTESKNLLFLNQGDGTFVERAGPLGLAITAASTGCAFADYDRDGDLDLYLLTNRVFGPNLPPELVADVTLPSSIEKSRDQLFPPFPEFRTDNGAPVVPTGYEDFFAVQHGRIFATGQRDRLLRNDGPAGFVDVSKAAGIDVSGNGLAVTWWDCDDDGLLDLYVSNDIHSPDRLWRNCGDGTFRDLADTALPHTAFFGMGCDFGDLDNDGRFDLCVADMSSTTHYMGKMLMGSMNNHRWFLMNASPQQYMRNALYRNTGTGRFQELGHMAGLASTDWTWSVRFADLDEDGRLDFHATNGIPVFEDNPDTIASYKQLVQAGQKAKALDLARSMQRVDERNVCKQNRGDFVFVDVGAEWGLDELGVSHGAVFVDLDRDGDLDLVTNNLNTEASVFENRTTDTHRVLVSLRSASKNTFGVGARIEIESGGVAQSRLVSPTRGYMSAGEPIEHFGLATGATIATLTVKWPSGAVQTFRGLAADRHYEVRELSAATVPSPSKPLARSGAWPLLTRTATLPVRHRERDFDDYKEQPLLPHRLSRSGPGLAVGDIDGDGDDDVFVGGAAGQAGTLLRSRGDCVFEAVAGPFGDDADCEDQGAVFIDYDRDGDLDLYVCSGGVEAGEKTELLRDRLYQNDGAGGFKLAPAGTLPDLRRSSGPVCTADFDGDGDLDLFVGTRVRAGRFPESEGSLLLRNDGGVFVDVTATVAPALLDAGMVTAAVWAHVDGDAWPDLVIAAQWQPLRLLRNEAGRALSDATADFFADRPSGQWQSLLAVDLDQDGRVELVAGNLGLNTKYKASAGHPLHLYAADFDGSGSFDVVEAKEVDGKLLPVRGLSCSSDAMPQLKVAFPTYDQFARATLPQIYGESRLSSARELQCDELRHLVFARTDGPFRATPLPRAAQVAPVQGIAAVDVDGDAVLDLVLAHNSFAPEPETGRFDGGLGLVLRGRGALQFEAIEPGASGFALGGDQKSLAVLDLDGDAAPDLLLATNDGPVHAFSTKRTPRGVAVRLRGAPGNPSAVGASLMVIEPSGRMRRARIDAGSGYLSQSAPVAFFADVEAGSVVQVVWPDGTSTRHGIDGTVRTLVLSQ